MVFKKKNILIIALLLIFVMALVMWGGVKIAGPKIFTVKKARFESVITSKGEIQGKNSVQIILSDHFKNRELHIHDLKIKELVAEGSIVSKGDWVANMDVANITEQIQRNKEDMDRRFAELNDAKIDTAIQLTRLREELSEFNYDLQYKKLELEQAKFESPAYQRKIQVAFNKTLRQMDKKHRDYELRSLELRVRMKRTEDYYMSFYRRDSLLKKAVEEARVVAPQNGMVMYWKDRGSRKVGVGSEISPWNPVIASLPDMSVVVSETYIEEIDITKIAIGDLVDITIDALPEDKFTGFVSKIANIGQELSGFDSKVFQVTVELNQTNTKLKPSMTTDNNIVIDKFNNVLTIPRQCLYSENGIDFVYLKKSGEIWKKKVDTGLENEKEVIIVSGLEENDRILFTRPEKSEEIKFLNE